MRPALDVIDREEEDAWTRDVLLRASVLDGRTIPLRYWIRDGWIPRSTVTMANGDGGTGKSTLFLHLAVAVATGRDWLGQTMEPGPVIFLSAEDDLDELHRRLDEICLGYGIGLGALDDLHIWPLSDRDAVLFVEGVDGQVKPTDRWYQLTEMAADVKPSLIVLDSLADIYSANENIRSQVRQAVGLLRRLATTTGAAVVVLSHPSLTGLNSGSGTSGSTAWSNSVRSRMYLTKPAGEGLDADPDLRLLSLKKSNYGRAQPDLRLRRQVGGFMLEDGLPSQALDMSVQRRRVDALFLDMLTAYSAQGRTVSDLHGVNYAPKVFAADALAKGVTKAGLAGAMNRLFASGEIAVQKVGPPSKPRHSLVRKAVADGC